MNSSKKEQEVWGNYPIFIFQEKGDQSYELLKASLIPILLKVLPKEIPDGGVRSLGSVSSMYESSLRKSDFCHTISSCGMIYTTYSCRIDGSIKATCSRVIDKKLHDSSWIKSICFDDSETNNNQEYIEFSYDSTISTYVKQPSGKLTYKVTTFVPCDRVRIFKIVNSKNYERFDSESGTFYNKGIRHFVDYILSIRNTMISRSVDKALILVIGQNGSLTRYREKGDVLKGLKMKTWEDYGDCMRPFNHYNNNNTEEDSLL